MLHIFPWLSQAQEKCGVVVDKESKLYIPYATLITQPFTAGTYTSEIGKYCISIYPDTDSILISCVGYQNFSVSKSQFLLQDTLFLEVSINQLKEVVVKKEKKKRKVIQVGYADHAVKKRAFGGSISFNSGIRIATYVSNDENLQGVIKNVIYVLSGARETKTVVVPLFYRIRLRIYENGSNHLPGADLLREQVVVDVPDAQKEIIKDVSSYNIAFPRNGFWVGMECVGYMSPDSVYHEIKVNETGKYTLKNSRKLKLEKLYAISPMIPLTKTKITQSTHSSLKGNWHLHERSNGLSTFSFGAEIELE